MPRCPNGATTRSSDAVNIVSEDLNNHARNSRSVTAAAHEGGDDGDEGELGEPAGAAPHTGADQHQRTKRTPLERPRTWR
eukprot:11091929-Karenia_brevis.AAC.1